MQRSLELLELAQHSHDTYYQALALWIAGHSQRHIGEYHASLGSFEQMLALPQTSRDEKTFQGWAYNGIGLAYRRMGQYKASIQSLEKFLKVTQRMGDTPGQGRAYCNLGIAYHEMGQYIMAIHYLEKDLGIAQQLHHKPGLRIAYKWLASAYDGMGQSDRAIDYAQKELHIAQQLNDRPGLGAAYGDLGNAHYTLGQHQAAIAYHQQHLEIAVELDDIPIQGIAYNNLARAYVGLGQHQMAIDSGHKSLEIAQQLDDRPEQRIAHSTLGLAYAGSGQPGLACSHFAASDDLVRETETLLADGQWRRHLLSFGEECVHFLDEWVLAAGRSGDMVEALRVEERRRCQSELAYQADVMRGRHDVSVDGLKAIASSAGAAFVIVTKMFSGRLLTWVLSGETGDLLYANIEDIEERESAIKEWTKGATFAEWAEWQRALKKAQQWLINEERNCRPVSRTEMKKAVELLIPENMKSDVDEELWEVIHDPVMFPETVSGLSGAYKELRRHFFQKAEKAMEELSKLLWQPIVEKCPAVRDVVRGDAPHAKPVRQCLSNYELIPVYTHAHTHTSCALPWRMWLQIYFVPDPDLSFVPFCALKTGEHFLIEKALVAQASSLRTLDCARLRWDTICNEAQLPSKVGNENSEAATVYFEQKSFRLRRRGHSCFA